MSTRRQFLHTLGAGVVGLSLVRLLDGCETNTVVPLTSGSDIPFITPSADMYVQNGAQASIAQWTMPQLDAATWRLAVTGLVTTPATFSLADLNTLGAASMLTFFKTQQCVYDAPLLSGVTGLTGNAYWTGFPLKVLLDHCGVDMARAKRVRFYGAEGFTNNLPLARIYGTQAADAIAPMLVTAMNGATLSAEHGFPLRLVVTEMFGFKNVKWLTRIDVTDLDTSFGTYQDAGFFDDGTLGVNSRMTRPLANVAIGAGAYQLSGFAIAGAAGVTAVDVSIDGGAWQSAEIVTIEEVMRTEMFPSGTIDQIVRSLPYPYRGVWTKWRFTWNAVPGAHALRVRATDGAGNVQPAVDNNLSDGTNGIVTANVTVS